MSYQWPPDLKCHSDIKLRLGELVRGCVFACMSLCAGKLPLGNRARKFLGQLHSSPRLPFVSRLVWAVMEEVRELRGYVHTSLVAIGIIINSQTVAASAIARIQGAEAIQVRYSHCVL